MASNARPVRAEPGPGKPVWSRPGRGHPPADHPGPSRQYRPLRTSVPPGLTTLADDVPSAAPHRPEWNSDRQRRSLMEVRGGTLVPTMPPSRGRRRGEIAAWNWPVLRTQRFSPSHPHQFLGLVPRVTRVSGLMQSFPPVNANMKLTRAPAQPRRCPAMAARPPTRSMPDVTRHITRPWRRPFHLISDLRPPPLRRPRHFCTPSRYTRRMGESSVAGLVARHTTPVGPPRLTNPIRGDRRTCRPGATLTYTGAAKAGAPRLFNMSGTVLRKLDPLYADCATGQGCSPRGDMMGALQSPR